MIDICIQLLEKPSESVISSLMSVSSWSGAKIRNDENVWLSFPASNISAVVERQEKINSANSATWFVMAVDPGVKAGPDGSG